MVSNRDKRDALLRFLDRKVFDPILDASPESYPDDLRRRKLADMKGKTESEKRRFHENYRSAEDVKENYLADVRSDSAKRVNQELEDLNLPRLPQFKQEFLKLCRRLQV